ncbi:MAG TPA: PASTA domain-containing protein [Gaiellaceae bacterium]|nr:PASTA domain-containing protein [Gaiellaceae bacterium]
MRTRFVALLAVVLAATACGTTAKPKALQREAVPDVRGMNAPDAAVRLIKARYCVRLKPGTPPANDIRPKPGKFKPPRMTVEQQSPSPGSTRRRWSMVTLTVGGISAHAATYIAVWDGGARIPCPKISTTG